jgi:hypothetical protein
MPSELFDIAQGTLRLSIVFGVALFLPLILQLLFLYAASWLLNRVVGLFSLLLYRLLKMIGTPVHELSHALGCWITLAGVDAIKLLSDRYGVGFVQPRRQNLLSGVVSSVAPLFGATLVLWLTATQVIPGFEVPTVLPPQLDLESAASLGTVLRESMSYMGRFFETAFRNLPNLQWDNWQTYVGLYIALSVGMGITPSSQDLRILVAALPLALLVGLGFFAWIYLSGNPQEQFLALQQGLVPALLTFSTAVTYAFVVASVGVLVFLPLAILRKLVARSQVA